MRPRGGEPVYAGSATEGAQVAKSGFSHTNPHIEPCILLVSVALLLTRTVLCIASVHRLPIGSVPGSTQTMGQLDASPYVLSRRRFIILALYVVSNGLNGMLWVTFSPIFQASADLFSVTPTAINFFSTVFLFAYIPGAFLSVYTMERYGLRWCLVSTQAPA